MIIRDWYISVLEKRAEEEALGVDNSAAAHQELASNQSEQKKELSGLFSHTGESEKKETAVVRKHFPAARKAKDTTSSSTLLKIATHRAFFDGVRETALMKVASPEYIRTAYHGFQDELAKIGSSLPK
jgi:hypothetical protein